MPSAAARLHAHQRRHGEADDLDTAVVMPLRLKVLMFAGVAPRRGASTVPAAGRQTKRALVL